ncbi:membrane dipeptidase [Streptomyces uncialis]|uniref:membrane dipeptidase n=1 Tax=Streptomyces uncialis TaxID=1048205 RepID=UPI00378DA470
MRCRTVRSRRSGCRPPLPHRSTSALAVRVPSGVRRTPPTNNLDDEQIRGIAATGGVICVSFFPGFLAADPAERTVARVVDHIEHVASVAGTAHVGLGPDFVREVISEVTPPCCEDFGIEGIDPLEAPPGLEGPAGLPLVTAELIRRGHPEKDVEAVLGGNVHRLFRAELGRPR